MSNTSTMTQSVDVLHPGDPRSSTVGTVLSRAFHDEPNFTYVLPDDGRRREALAWFFGSFVARLGFRYGSVYATDAADGAAIWMRPRSSVSLPGAIRAGLLRMPLAFGWSGSLRSMRLSGHIEKVRNKSARANHWYLMALGVNPEMQGRGLGSALIEPVIAEADADGTPCYLETFSERNLAFYQRHGFETIVEDRIPRNGPHFWGMGRVAGAR